MPGGEMSVCNAYGDIKDGKRTVMCKVTGVPATRRVIRQKLGLQNVQRGEAEQWRMQQPSLRHYEPWWPTDGFRAANFYANANFLQGIKKTQYQVAKMEEEVMFIHCTLFEE